MTGLVQYRIVYRLPVSTSSSNFCSVPQGSRKLLFRRTLCTSRLDLGQATFPIQCVEYVKLPGTGLGLAKGRLGSSAVSCQKRRPPSRDNCQRTDQSLGKPSAAASYTAWAAWKSSDCLAVIGGWQVERPRKGGQDVMYEQMGTCTYQVRMPAPVDQVPARLVRPVAVAGTRRCCSQRIPGRCREL